MGDVLGSGPDRPPWRPPRRLVVVAPALALTAALVAGIIVAVSGGRPGAAVHSGRDSMTAW